ncbi:survival motor neuron protein 1-like [Anguilla anguilla]|uniref:survival motor neuron protein 1-like n=1 Tax=Anguilla anguilla TaxID=7936 RepID=UPI0015A79A4B|nr:survival motor neuron protein 1-like [Anguilla anguilla]XP_035234836.1 survival motor neuron protein 1-like [Anguilla anguilla]
MANAYNEMLFTRGMGKSDDPDIWDDTALIKAYDKAVASFKNALKGEEESVESPKESKPGKKRKSNKKNRSRKRSNAIPEKEWKVGEACCAFWSVDGKLYPATVTSIDEEKGTCTVVYTAYGNEEEQNLVDLLSDNSEVEEDGAKMADQVKEGESSTDESDKCSSSQLPNHGPRSEPKLKPAGRPSAPPTGSTFRPPESWRPAGPGAPPPDPGAPPPGWPPSLSFGPPMVPPPPPLCPDSLQDDEALNCMLISWYMSGYHTGYYMGLRKARDETTSGKRPDPS